MLKDIFIDNSVIPKFSNPLDSEYKKLFEWLLKYDEKRKNNNAYLAVSKKLLGEYDRSLRNAHSSSHNFVVIIAHYKRNDRFNSIDNESIKTFKRKYFKKKIVRRLVCDRDDRNHIPVVMLSDRKYALSLDANFRRDINNFPGFSARATERPQDLPYDE